jgi:hypothetical protein
VAFAVRVTDKATLVQNLAALPAVRQNEVVVWFDGRAEDATKEAKLQQTLWAKMNGENHFQVAFLCQK